MTLPDAATADVVPGWRQGGDLSGGAHHDRGGPWPGSSIGSLPARGLWHQSAGRLRPQVPSVGQRLEFLTDLLLYVGRSHPRWGRIGPHATWIWRSTALRAS